MSISLQYYTYTYIVDTYCIPYNEVRLQVVAVRNQSEILLSAGAVKVHSENITYIKYMQHNLLIMFAIYRDIKLTVSH